MIDFIEFKAKGSVPKPPERKVKRLLDEGKVRYVIKDVDLPQHFQIVDREQYQTSDQKT